MKDALRLFVPITKIDAARREVWGCLAEEALDKSGEIFDYTSSKPFVEQWSAAFEKVTGGKSKGNLRRMHTPHVAGKFIAVECQDDARKVLVGAKVIDDADWAKCEEGAYTGFSVGGRYVDRWDDPVTKGAKRYTADPAEGSLVDNPCMYGATFEVVKADGSSELRKFAVPPASDGIGEITAAFAAEWRTPLTRTSLGKRRDVVQRWAAVLPARTSAHATTTVAKAAGLRKGLYDVQSLASCLGTLDWLLRSAVDEAESEGDKSPVPARFRSAIQALGAVLIAMTAEEVSELYANAATRASALLDEAITLHQAHMDGTEPTSMGSQQRLMQLIEQAAEVVREGDLGAGCAAAEKRAGDTPSQEDDMTTEDVQKLIGETLTKTFGDTDSALVKALGGVVEKAVKPLTEQVTKVAGDVTKLAGDVEKQGADLKTLTERVDTIGGAPAPAIGTVHVIDKSAETVVTTQQDAAPDFTKIADPELRGLAMLKHKLGKPGERYFGSIRGSAIAAA